LAAACCLAILLRIDLSPGNWTVLNEKIPVGLAIGQPKGFGGEAIAVQRAGDRLHPRPGRRGTAVEEFCRKAGFSIRTYYRWRKKYGGLMPSEMKSSQAHPLAVRSPRPLRIHILLRREGWTINHKRTRRLYREEGLQLRRKRRSGRSQRSGMKRHEDRVVATAAHDCCRSMDFLSDQLFDGRKIRVLTIVDNSTGVSPGDRRAAESSPATCCPACKRSARSECSVPKCASLLMDFIPC
jgi:hypothetical protein